MREAIVAANSANSDDVIDFDPGVFGIARTITLGGTQLQITNNGSLALNGPGQSLLTISGNNASRVFFISSGATAVFNAIKVSGGNSSGGNGGGIYSAGNLTINNSTIMGNTPGSGNGGGVFNEGAGHTLTLNFSTVSNNSGNGAGIQNTGGSVFINDSSIRNNSGINGTGILNANGPVNITNSSIDHNTAAGGGGIGGGILNGAGGTVTGTNVIISHNSAANGAGGGGIYNESGSVSLNNSQIISNTTAGADGAGIRNRWGLMNISNSDISNNSCQNCRGAGLSNYANFDSPGVVTLTSVRMTGNVASFGGAVYNENRGAVTIQSSTLSNNIGINGGGGIGVSDGTVNLTNSTVSNNSTNVPWAGGGGIQVGSGLLNLNHATVVNNTTGSDGGGGIRNGSGTATGTINLHNSIVADNTATGSVSQDVFGTLTSQGYNLIENRTGAGIIGVQTGNIFGQDPLIGTLRDNGGPTQTIALQGLSPAVDAADPGNVPLTDQRGTARSQDGDLNGSVLPDIGAYERQNTILTVTKTADTNDGNCDADCSLREAVARSNAGVEPDNVITFSSELFSVPQTLILSNTLTFQDHGTVMILGTGRDKLTISGNDQIRVLVNFGVLNIRRLTISRSRHAAGDGGTFNAFKMALDDTVITESYASDAGGGISNRGSLLIKNSVISNNVAIATSSSAGGGGVDNDGGSVTVINSIIRGNSTNSGGGAIHSERGNLRIVESTVHGNSAFSGGGIYFANGDQAGPIFELTNSTISGNNARRDGGGIHIPFSTNPITLNYATVAYNTANSDGLGTGSGGGIRYGGSNAPFNLRNSIIANNDDTNTSPDFGGTVTSSGYNLIRNTNGTTITGTTTGNILGQDPKLFDQLALNGGTTPTHALRIGSPAIDSGSASNPAVTTDQRGRSRPYDFQSIPNAPGGNSSDIGAFERGATDTGVRALFDYDGDGRADLSVRRPSDNVWHLLRATAGYTAQQFGEAGDRMTPADYDGDGKTDVSVFRPSTGQWFMFMSESQTFEAFGWGENGDLPVPTDRDNDGRTDLVIFRPSNNTWYTRFANGTFHTFEFGVAGDKPVVGDFDADGIGDIALFRPSNNNWYIIKSSLGYFIQTWGEEGDTPITGDFDGDGATDQAAFRPSTGRWYLSQTTAGFAIRNWGEIGDIPVAADYDGDGKTDVAVFRPSNGTWYIVQSTAGILVQQFGETGDVPTQTAFNY